MSGAPSPATAAQRLVSPRLRVIQRDFLTRRGGRTNLIRSSTAVGYSPAAMAPYAGDASKCPWLVDAEVIHGDEQAFWTERRSFYRGGASRSFYPLWDRQAQALIMLTREVVRVPQAAAFRLFALGLKVMVLPRLVSEAELMLPAWLSTNAEALLVEAGIGKEGGDEAAKRDGEAAMTDAAAAAPAPAPEDSPKT